MNSARSVLLATMPPTLAAARNTACGFFLANQSNTAAWLRRSSSARFAVRSSTFSAASRRAIAEPAMPRCPATKTVLPFSSNGVLAIGDLQPGLRKVAGHHFLDQLRKARLRLPAELLPRLAGIADQEIDLGGAEIDGIDPHHGLAGLLVDAGLLDALAAPFDAAADLGKGELDELAHRARLAGGEHEVVGRVRLQDGVHALDVVAGMAPVALGFEVAEIERLLQPRLDAGDAAGDLAGDEGLAADRALMVEQDAVTGKHAIGLAVVHRDPVAIELCDAVRRAWIERRGLLLRDLLHETIELGGRGLVEPRLLLHAEDADGLQEAQHADGIRIGGIFRALEADADMALGGEVVDLGRPDLLHQADQVGGIRHVAVVHQERHVADMGILVEMIDAGGVEGGRAPLDAVHGIAETE